MKEDTRGDLGRILRQRRRMIPMTLKELSAATGVSGSHLGRIENGNRLPSGHIVRKIAKPLGFEEDELLVLAGFKTPKSSENVENLSIKVDPCVANLLSQEPVEVQRAVVAVLTILKGMARSLGSDGRFGETGSSRRGKSEQVGRDKRQRTYH